MSVFLAIETSGALTAVAISRDGRVVAERFDAGVGAAKTGLDCVVSEAFAAAEVSVADLSAVAVNIGPGGLGAVRSGVAFANALTYGAGLPLRGFSFFEIAGRQLGDQVDRPVLSVIPAAGERAFAGLWRSGRLEAAAFGNPDEIVPRICAGTAEIWTAGRLRARVAEWLPDHDLHDGGIEAPDPKVMLMLLAEADRSGGWTGAQPLVETSGLFHEPS